MLAIGRQHMELLGYTLFRFKTAFASLFLFVCVLLLASLITATGKGTVFDSRTTTETKPLATTRYDTPNYVTKAGYEIISGTKSLTIASGTALFKTSKAITEVSSSAASTVADAGINTVQAVTSGVATAAKTVGGGALAVVKGTANATTAITSSPAGSYPITAATGTLTAANYSFSFVKISSVVSV